MPAMGENLGWTDQSVLRVIASETKAASDYPKPRKG